MGADVAPTIEDVIDGEGKLIKKTIMNGFGNAKKLCWLHGSNAVNGQIQEANHVTDYSDIPKDVVDEWPADKQTHTFYFVKHRTYEDPKLKAKIDQADKEVQRKNQARTQIMEALREKKSERADLISQLKPLRSEEKQFRNVMDGKRKEMEPLQAALGKLRGGNIAATEKGVGLCSSEEELNELIKGLQYCIQHESNTLAAEKQLLKEIKQLEASREKVIANAAMRAKIQESFDQRDVIQDQVKLIGSDLDGVRKEQQAIRSKIRHLEEKLEVVEADIESLQKDFATVNVNRDKAYQTLIMLRKERDESNAGFFQYRSLMNNARDLSAIKDIIALEKLSHSEVDKFMSQWNSSKPFRDDYERRLLSSLDLRQLSRDGRIRNPDEKPILAEAPISIEVAKEPPSKPSNKKEKEKIIPGHYESDTAKPAEVEAGKKITDNKNSITTDKPKYEPLKPNDTDPTKLKEMKREEEIAKAKLAMERKKKLADKAAAKAAVRAQKEAEKKQKEKEKKARKKAGMPPADTEQPETEIMNFEPKLQEETNVNTQPSAPEKIKGQPKEKAVRLRSQPKAESQIPRVIFKRKKSNPYWIGIASAAIFVLLLVAFGYYYSSAKFQSASEFFR